MPPAQTLGIVVLAAGAEQRAAKGELKVTDSVMYCDTVARLAPLLSGTKIDVLVTQLRDASGAAVAPAIESIHIRYPNLPIVAYVTPSPSTLNDLPASLAAGVSECTFRGFDKLGRTIAIATARGWHAGAAALLVDTFRPLLVEDLREFGVACATKGSPRLSADRVAEWLRVSERTLRARLQRLGLKPPSAFIEFSAAVHAAYLLDKLGEAVERVAGELGFANRRALNRLLRIYTGKGARDFRQHDSVVSVLAAHERFLYRNRALLLLTSFAGSVLPL